MPPSPSPPHPLGAAQSTGGSCPALLAALLTIDLDEISSADDYEAIAGYVAARGRAGEDGRTRRGLVLWGYPTCEGGPCRTFADGHVERHGVLFTVERGARAQQVVQQARVAIPAGGIAHVHVAAEIPPQAVDRSS
ncbi:hypothetical protein B0H21DRAFT_459295 [Amylocystis lapponica]|nr:hypothetical protein B0H21DRAFT_459295 [Amylocystis lapponica]